MQQNNFYIKKEIFIETQSTEYISFAEQGLLNSRARLYKYSINTS